VCNYCGCRAIEPIARLTSEHEQILALSHEIRTALSHQDHAAASEGLRRLRDVLEVHDAVEELALYPAMARQRELAEKVGTLFDEHDELDRVIGDALQPACSDGLGPEQRAALATALETLAEHIDHEEHGLFPAAAVSLDPSDWERATAVRLDMAARTRPGLSDHDDEERRSGA